MKLVIEMDEKLYGRIFHSDAIYDDDKESVVKDITSGTPLPKRHGRLKDVDKLSYKCMHENSSECNHMMCDTCQFYCVAKYEIEDEPTIIESEKRSESNDRQ